MNENCPLLWRLSLTEAGLATGYIFLRNLPEPSNCVWKSFSGKFSQSDGGQVQHGMVNVRLRWEALLPQHAWRLYRYLTLSLAGTNLLYLTVKKNDASGVGYNWVDCRGIPHPPDFEEGGTIAGNRGMFYSNVEVFVNNVVIINDPAQF